MRSMATRLASSALTFLLQTNTSTSRARLLVEQPTRRPHFIDIRRAGPSAGLSTKTSCSSLATTRPRSSSCTTDRMYTRCPPLPSGMAISPPTTSPSTILRSRIIQTELVKRSPETRLQIPIRRPSSFCQSFPSATIPIQLRATRAQTT